MAFFLMHEDYGGRFKEAFPTRTLKIFFNGDQFADTNSTQAKDRSQSTVAQQTEVTVDEHSLAGKTS